MGGMRKLLLKMFCINCSPTAVHWAASKSHGSLESTNQHRTAVRQGQICWSSYHGPTMPGSSHKPAVDRLVIDWQPGPSWKLTELEITELWISIGPKSLLTGHDYELTWWISMNITTHRVDPLQDPGFREGQAPPGNTAAPWCPFGGMSHLNNQKQKR